VEFILLEDVKSLGKKGQIVKVNDGYARNFILPKNLGIEATKQNLNNLKLKQAHDEKMKQEALEEAKLFAAELSTKSIEVKMKAGTDGRVFGSISTKEISQEAKNQLNYELDKKKMQLKEPIRSFGTHIVPIKIHPQVVAELKVVVKEL